jgi:diguanylate cyclase (GGDEF)-like protein
MIVFAVVGIAVTRRNDVRLEDQRHAALRQSLDELHAVFGDVDHFDYGQLRLIERRAGLTDLKFETDPTTRGDREVQSLHDAEGRIVGWFSWAPERGLVSAMYWLWGLVGVVGAALMLCALLATRTTLRIARALARSVETTRKLTSEDSLTELPNQRVMVERLNDVLARRRSGIVAFALVDLDNFREINDTIGRGGGDNVIKSVAQHLKAGLPDDALFGRFEDDEFAIIMTSNEARIGAVLADAIRASLLRPIFMDRMWQVTAGIGTALAPDDGTTGEELARRAGLALRAAKRRGRGAAQSFALQIETEHTERRFLLRELEAAISLQAFDVHYQPVVAAAGGKIVGVEALLRWTHATRGSIPPSVFIPLAEQSGLMSQLGEIVLRRALADGARWPDLRVAVNLSPVQMRDRWLVDLVGTVVAETGIAASRVVLEVTEGILIDNPQDTQAKLEALRALGVRIALDDFGTGYSSLSYLQKFPFDQLKIDRAFVASLGTSGNTGSIIQSIVTLGHALGMKVVAEGVETDEQRVLLRLAGCDEMQGFLFARPGPADEIDAALAESQSLRPAVQ